jgi:methylated-DNA-[protein]-cysteine S-methyltransferase
LRRNPFAPDVPCHRVIASSGYVGGFLGEWNEAPSGVNQSRKLDLLKVEGVRFDGQGKLLKVEGEEVWFDGPWDVSETRGVVEGMVKEAGLR